MSAPAWWGIAFFAAVAIGAIAWCAWLERNPRDPH